ncbi:MAG TPA: MBL fold metallo-hydrolase [Nocardioides sp.]|uniref:MBL fold metallo-hydrolase RNA specificity domain-containing protein n=1 Tax=uncultured Nocardioides sp. TaxID=198441 RepID=UPI000EE930FB|nr:MBL fold metallo-hydrolase [uncultured Nocardioides sp.]HCB06656.1 MBL fold metallo-hydrolase [Nocardioides sp.]HRD61041.1 MBL fold metallo-hydrolase [Nocardioides sp.]HRI95037.1 MBL fold metallo-hydrolase [Nocardioides sp.]HRK45292.1 MBL fold metallo-hydrolase [Nocardioides sp.]
MTVASVARDHEPVLSFLGAAGCVTGSRFLVEGRDIRLLVDAGLYQGLAELRRRNWDPLGPDPASLDAVVVTHAHLDHSGYLPRLVRDGFRGRIICTRETAELAEIVLRDSAHLQEEDAAYANEAGFTKHHPALPLYDARDVERVLPLFEPVAYGASVALSDGASVTLQRAGHILGSATALVEVDGARALFSGDLGRPDHPLLERPDDPPEADVVVVESTYGDRVHPQDDDGDLLAEVVCRTIGRGGSVLIPAFAVDRTELVLLGLRRLREAGRIPDVPVYVDSPMALATLEVYRSAAHRPASGMRPGSPELAGGHVVGIHDAASSQRLNKPRQPCILISASGMATGGRVVHHLRYQLPDPRNTVILTGYQAEGSRGRQLASGARQVKIHGRYVPVRAEIVQLETMSVHADADDLVAWLSRMPLTEHLPTAYVVHGEAPASAALARRISDELDWCAVAPRLGERVVIG